MDDEILDVVDGFDVVIGSMKRKDYDAWVQEKDGYIRAAELFIVNDKGKVWVPVRTADKRIAPGGYDFSVDGHPAKSNLKYAVMLLQQYLAGF